MKPPRWWTGLIKRLYVYYFDEPWCPSHGRIKNPVPTVVGNDQEGTPVEYLACPRCPATPGDLDDIMRSFS